MVARNSAKERAKLRRSNEQLIRRSPILSNGAKLLWLELSAWAWDDPTCYPKQDLIVLALGATRFSVTRWAKELASHDLITIRRQRRGNEYVLTEEVPFEVCDPARGFNKNLVRMLRGEDPRAETQHEEPADVIPDVAEMQHPNVAEMQQDPPSHVASVQHPNVAKMQHVDEVVQEEVHQEEREVDQGEEMRELQATHAFQNQNDSSMAVGARCARLSEEANPLDLSDEEQRTYVPETPQPEDPSELMADEPLPKTQHRKSRRKLRGPDPAIASTQHAMRDAGKLTTGIKTAEVSPPPPEAPEDVLALLRGEVEAKFGAGACRGMPLNLTGKDRGMVKNAILGKYAPDVVISMVRVLVWDWEIARASIFPYRPQVKIPTIESLVQYQETLASAVDTGLKYTGASRGVWKTYASRYLEDANPSVVEPDPF